MSGTNLDENAAREVAANWAIARGRLPPKFQSFAVEHLRLYPNTDQGNLEVHLHFFDLATEDAKAQWNKYCHAQTNWSGEWMLETVKHLAIINAAGIAGAATLLATQGADGWVKFAFCFFTFGLMLSVLDLWLCACGFQARSEEGNRRFVKARDSVSWQQWSKSLDPVLHGKKWFKIAERVGWTAAVLWVAAASSLGVHLFK